MNTFLIIYLGILLFEAVLSTILKYAWQSEDEWDEPFYNQKTEQERNSSPVSLLHSKHQKNSFFFYKSCKLSDPGIRFSGLWPVSPCNMSFHILAMQRLTFSFHSDIKSVG